MEPFRFQSSWDYFLSPPPTSPFTPPPAPHPAELIATPLEQREIAALMHGVVETRMRRYVRELQALNARARRMGRLMEFVRRAEMGGIGGVVSEEMIREARRELEEMRGLLVEVQEGFVREVIRDGGMDDGIEGGLDGMRGEIPNNNSIVSEESRSPKNELPIQNPPSWTRIYEMLFRGGGRWWVFSLGTIAAGWWLSSRRGLRRV